MTQQHPITPPPELVQNWFLGARAMPVDQWVTDVATQAAQWGADIELEACCEWLVSEGWFKYEHEAVEDLRTARRPKPPSLKEQALALLDPSTTYGSVTRDTEYRISVTKAEIIRRALEQLND